MTRRTLSTTSFLAAAALLILSEQAAFSGDTLWDLLRNGTPASKRAASTPLTLDQIAQARLARFDPVTGLLRGSAQASPESEAGAKARKRRGGVLRLFDDMGNGLQSLGKRLNSKLEVHGEHNMGFHMESVSGTREAYDNSHYFGQRGVGGVYQRTDLTIRGKLFGLFNFEQHFSNNLYGNPYDNRVSLNYANKTFKVDAGDINGSIIGNSLIDFNRTLKGVQLSVNATRNLRFTALYSQIKAQTRTITIPGGNSPGPYYVYAGRIVDGSVKVRVNDREMTLDKDYKLDVETGELMFTTGTIIHELDTIAVTFETYGYNQTAGLLSGYRADLNPFKGAKMGVTYLSQSSNRDRNRSRTKTDQFLGYENPVNPYTLDYPVEVTLIRDKDGNIVGATPVYPMIVLAGAIPQIYGTDYVIDPLLTNRIFFRHGVPANTIIKITYIPLNLDETPGNRRVLGFDSTFSLGKLGNIVAEMASSKFNLSGKGVQGGAWQVRGDMKFLKDRLHWNWNVRDIGANFTAIESPGFRRNERGVTLGFDYLASRTLKFTASIEKTKRPSYDYSGFGTGSSTGYAQSKGMDDFTLMNFGANWMLGRGGQLSLNHNSMTTQLFGGGKSLFTTDNIAYSATFKALSFDVSLGRNVNQSDTYFGTGQGSTPQLTSYGTDSLTSRFGLKWRANRLFSLSAVFANSALKSRDGRSSNAQDMNFQADITPLRNMKVMLGYSLQNSGSYSLFNNNTGQNGSASGRVSRQAGLSGGGLTGSGLHGGTTGVSGYSGSGFYSGGSAYGQAGLGYGGYNGNLGNYGNYSGGFYNGAYSGYGSSNFAGRSRGLILQWSYQPWNSLSLDFNWNNSASEGDYLFNSRRNDLVFHVGYNLGEQFSLDTSFSTQKVRYTGSTGGTASHMLAFYLRARPFRRLTTTLNYSLLKTASSLLATGGTGTGTTTGGSAGGTVSTGFYGSGGTNLNSYGLRLEYPVWRGNILYFQYDNASSSGYLASLQRGMQVGIDFDLGNSMVFRLGWRDQYYLSLDGTNSSAYNYHARSLDADFFLRFN